MSLHNEDRELQIELVNLQIDHEYLTSTFMGNLAIAFGFLIGLVSVYYGLYGKPIHFLIPYSLLVIMFATIIVIYFTLWRYKKNRERLKRRIEELRERYVW